MGVAETSDFWRFSLALYGREGVPPACLTLQDGSGVDVNVMLYGLWLATRGRALAPSDMAAIDAAMGQWRADIVVPLRAVRRVLKEPMAAFAGPETQALRDRVKAIELEAERLQQEALHRLREPQEWGRSETDLKTAAAANLAAYSVMLEAPFEPAAEAAMLDGLMALEASGKLAAVAERGGRA